MNYRTTKSGLKFSELGLGCMNLPTDYHEAQSILKQALDSEITYFDTADLYNKGDNEKLLGRFFKENGHRQDIVLGSKVGNEFSQQSDEVKWNPSREHILHGIKDSLHRLGTDYLDLYMLHGGTIEDNMEETLDAFNILKQDGLIRAYGISSIRPNVIREYLDHSDIDVIMMQFNLLDNRPEMLLDEIAARDVKVLARGPVMKGLLTDQSQSIIARKFEEGVFDYSKEELTQTLSNVDEPLTVSTMNYLLSQPVASIVAGASSVDQLTTNVQYYEQVDYHTHSRERFQNLQYEQHL
ncbi:aldo/keto reductase [Macrococcus hajekii]|uniref:Aldo/keto reductase n=1 Tax=Macrococcus hajekii TaxID=198482 RepID=A0A4R6BMA7_9STAP|nr:aldo/keto reductase [Macrococcus hajekii]TDM02953.1 aldo/keto reductase [Macrococcus hajekii]GGB05233.1 oxidoreductase [Macrococcus hajekii]